MGYLLPLVMVPIYSSAELLPAASPWYQVTDLLN